tara:strand:+ start:22111 stop:23838 length:1728 start_codon:yes stop_codon:yes gene_type:complete
MLDYKLENGLIIDGTGREKYTGSVGIKDGVIVSLGECGKHAKKTIDCEGRVIAPGFVDVHTHYDAQVFWDPALSPSCFHGVTTVFGGFCGFSIAPLNDEAASYLLPMLARVEGMPEKCLAAGVPWDWTSTESYLAKLEGNVGLNAGFMAGHSAIRRVVMGDRAVGEAATDEELAQMKALLRESLEAGAMGFSTTTSPTHNDADGNPVPSRSATREELLELASVCRDYEGTTLELLPNLNFDDDTVELLADFSLAGGRPVNWNVLAVMTADDAAREQVKKQLAVSDYAREKGAEVIALTAAQTMTIRINLHNGVIFDSLPDWAWLFKLPVAERAEQLALPDVRAQLEAGAKKPSFLSRVADWPTMNIVETFSEETRPYQGRTVGNVAQERGTSAFDTMIDIALMDGLKTSFMPASMGNDLETNELRARICKDDRTVVGASDAGAHLDMIDSFAYSTKLLENACRKYEVLTFEEAIHQLTEVPANLMGLKRRGTLATENFADIVILDPNEVACGKLHTRFDLPGVEDEGRLYMDAIGIDHVFVNGEMIIEDGTHTGRLPGKILRSGKDTYTVSSMAK